MKASGTPLASSRSSSTSRSPPESDARVATEPGPRRGFLSARRRPASPGSRPESGRARSVRRSTVLTATGRARTGLEVGRQPLVVAGPPLATVIDVIPLRRRPFRGPRPCCVCRQARVRKILVSSPFAICRPFFPDTRCAHQQQRRVTMSVDVGKLSAEEKEKMYSAATTEMEYRVELFNKCVSCHRPSLIARLDVSSRSRLRRRTPSSLFSPPCRRFRETQTAESPHALTDARNLIALDLAGWSPRATRSASTRSTRTAT